KQLAVDDDAAADAGANRHADDVRSAARRTLPPFADRRTVRVVVERRGKMESFGNPIAQREIPPAEIRRDDHESLLAIERSRRTNADADEITPTRARLRDGVENHALDQPDDAIGDALCAGLRRRGDRAHRIVLLAVGRHRADDDVGAAEVYAD